MSIHCQTLVRSSRIPYSPFFTFRFSDPSDIAALEETPIVLADIQIDATAEAARPELKRQAQEWASLKQDPDADLFVFVGRWSKQKGVDLIADIMPSM
jgi:alpha-1,3-glucan synthase